MSDVDVTELRRLLAAARLPWRWGDTERRWVNIYNGPAISDRVGEVRDHDAVFVVAAVNALPVLLDRLDAAEARVAALEAEMAAASIGLVGLSAKQREYADLAQARIAALEAAARQVLAFGGDHAEGCLIRDYGGCTCGWENALGALAALLDGDT